MGSWTEHNPIIYLTNSFSTIQMMLSVIHSEYKGGFVSDLKIIFYI